MKKITKVFLALMLAVALIATCYYASAASNTISEEEINAIVNTTTDASQVTSPFIQVANQVRNSVVGVNNYTSGSTSFGYGYGYGNGRGGQSRETLNATGSGVVISDYGHVLTNYHVVEGASRVTVTTALDESEHEAEVVGYDADLDIAVLYVAGLNLPAVPLGDSDQLQVGEWAIVIGNPLGEEFARTMTVGVVSAIDRQVTDTSTDRYGRRTSVTNTMIQVDAAINSGNSGGGMFNTLGQLQGIPARKYSSSGLFSTSIDNIGMCIPINVAKPLIQQVLRDYSGESAVTADNGNGGDWGDSNGSSGEGAIGGENGGDNGWFGSNGGSASGDNNGDNNGNNNGTEGNNGQNNNSMIGKPRLGVTVTTLNSGSYDVIPKGAFVKEVEDGSPAAEAGIQPGDIIVEVDGAVVSSSTDMVNKLSGGYAEGDTITIKVYRDEALASQADQSSFDMTNVGDGEYMDLTVILRVIDNVSM